MDKSLISLPKEIPVFPLSNFIIFPNTLANLAGDTNFDGEINILDVVILISAILYQEFDDAVFNVSDLNGDGELNVVDIVLLVNLILG